MKILQRYWVAVLLIAMVVVHAAIIGYVRSQIARLNEVDTTTVAIGAFRFQPTARPTTVYQFDLHAVLDPGRRHQAKERIMNQRYEILEAAELMLRQTPTEVLQDPAQTVLRERLMEVILEQVTEPVVQRVVITGWLQLPVEHVELPGTREPATVRIDRQSAGERRLEKTGTAEPASAVFARARY